MDEEELFHAARGVPAADQERVLAAAAPAVRDRVRVLLAAAAPDSFLAGHAADPAATAPFGSATTEAGPAAGDRVGPYTLRERLGEGGMGEVWVAEQTAPVKRRVAVKLIKPGMDNARAGKRRPQATKTEATLRLANRRRDSDDKASTAP